METSTNDADGLARHSLLKIAPGQVRQSLAAYTDTDIDIHTDIHMYMYTYSVKHQFEMAFQPSKPFSKLAPKQSYATVRS